MTNCPECGGPDCGARSYWFQTAEVYRQDLTAWARQTLLDNQQVLLETHES
jgi:hypothetical protein